jgi:transposase
VARLARSVLMSRAIHPNRQQVWLLPPSTDEWVAADHPARFVVALIESLDLKALGFRQSPGDEGRPHYAPTLLLAVWVFGWMERIRSSRALEKACQRDLAFVWLTGNIRLDHVTLWRFFDANRSALKTLFKQVVRVAANAGLVGFVLHALDGTKLRAASSMETALHQKQLEDLLKELDKIVETMASETAAAEQQPAPDWRMPGSLATAEGLKKRIRDTLDKMKQPAPEAAQPPPEAAQPPAEAGRPPTASPATAPELREAQDAAATTPAKDVAATTPAQDVAATTPAQDVAATTPAQDVTATTTAQDVAATTPAQDVAATTPAQDVAATTPAQDVTATTSAQDVAATTPAQDVAATTPAQDVAPPQPAQDVAAAHPEQYVAATPEQTRKDVLEALALLKEHDTRHLHPNEPDARTMKTREGPRLAYNAQIVVDHDSDLIVAADISGDETDHAQLVPMIERVLETCGRVADHSVADAGYASGGQFQEAHRRHLPIIVNVQDESSSKGPYAKSLFTYHPERDVYVCPLGEVLPFEATASPTTGKPQARHIYRCHNDACSVRAQCTKDKKGRAIKRLDSEEAFNRQVAEQSTPAKQILLDLRKEIVEHVFGIAKAVDGFTRFTAFGLAGAGAQWALACLAINMRKLLPAWREHRLQLSAAT